MARTELGDPDAPGMLMDDDARQARASHRLATPRETPPPTEEVFLAHFALQEDLDRLKESRGDRGVGRSKDERITIEETRPG